ncbi:MAG: rRNA maturation RNase YbeY [Candidatus Gracilibacteria bacterium]|nr:rRNA maturation RNase YbeY [Candidatus Gracilibacteria bacterium]
MFSYQILNHPEKFTLDTSRIQMIFERIDEMVDIPQKGILDIAFLSDTEIQALNRDHRGIDKTTDVLSFHYFEDFTDVADDDIAGEIILSESRILTQAEEYGHTAEKEFETLVIHSILHIIGFDHETDEDYEAMWSYEEPLRKEILI